MNKTIIICVVMILATAVMRITEMISLPVAIFSLGYWILQICIRDTNKKIEKASKNPNVKINKDSSRFI